MDFGKVTKEIKINPTLPEDVIRSEYFKSDAEKFHTSYGAGLRIAMNENFIISVDYGMAADEQDGNSGMYIGLNYLF